MKQPILSLMALSLVFFTMTACSDEKNNEIPDKTYSVGDFYNTNGVKGIVYNLNDDTGKHGMIVSLDETTAQWAIEAASGVKVGASDMSDGMKNMAVVEAIDGWQTKFPAFAWCEAKNTSGVTGWFLPAFNQLNNLLKVYVADPVAFNASLTKNGGMAITTEPVARYWSSSENLATGTDDAAAYIGIGEQSVGFISKANVIRVRAVRAF